MTLIRGSGFDPRRMAPDDGIRGVRDLINRGWMQMPHVKTRLVQRQCGSGPALSFNGAVVQKQNARLAVWMSRVRLPPAPPLLDRVVKLMPDDPLTETAFFRKTGVKLDKKLLVGGGTGLSAAALIYIHAVFAHQSDLVKMQQAQTTQWQQISELHQQVTRLEGRNAAYELLLRYVTAHQVMMEEQTNTPAGPSR